MIKEDAPTVNIGSGNIPGAGVAAAGKPANFGDAIVSSGAAKQWKKQNAMFRRKSPMAEEQIDELKRQTLGRYIKKASDSRAKNQGDAEFYQKKGITSKNQKKYGKAIRNVINRRKGIRTATDKLVKEETFAGAVVFEVNSKLFHNLTMQKRKGKHWRTYLEEDDCYAEIREWAKKNPKGKIVVRNESTGEMRYVRY
jgi:S1-C subfamily serine protease